MWNERYSEPGYAYGTSPNDYLVSVAPQLPSGPILSMAEGEGRNAVFLATRGHTVHAVDASQVGLDKAQALARDLGVAITTEVSDLATYDFGESRWATIISIFCHLPPRVRARCHAAVVQALVPGGLFVLEAYRPEQLHLQTGGPQHRELLVTTDDLRAELAGLEFLALAEVDREIREGRFHQGPSATVQCLARKAA
jgi:SAM-dependent methyltransferase